MPEDTFNAPVAFIKASVATEDDAESVVRVKLIY